MVEKRWVGDLSSSPCPVKVNEAHIRGISKVPVPSDACQEHDVMTVMFISTDNVDGGTYRLQ